MQRILPLVIPLVNFYNNHKIWINIFLLIVTYSFIYTHLIGNYLTNYVEKNLHWLKNKPWFIPISGFFKTATNTGFFSTFTNNVTDYFSIILKKCIHIFLFPFVYIFKLITSIVANISGTLDKFRRMATVIRQLFKKLVQNVFQKIENSFTAMTYFNEKFKVIVKKQVAMFTLFTQFAKSTKYVFQSFYLGPVPKMASFLVNYGVLMLAMLAMCLLCPIPFVGLIACPICLVCFDENTEVATKDGYIKIIDIQIGDELVDGGIVTGVLTTLAEDLDVYKLDNDIVSGSHMIYKHNEWNRVEDIGTAELVKDYDKPFIYCLNTTTNLIYTKNNIYADYQETTDIDINLNISKCVTKSLNRGVCQFSETDKDHQYFWGFSGDTFISKLGKTIKELSLEDCSVNSGLHGIVKLDGRAIQLYDYMGIVVSGNQLVYEHDEWIRIHQSTLAKSLPYHLPTIYHIILENNQLEIGCALFTDFCETNDNNANKVIDEYVRIYKNKNDFPKPLEFYNK